MAASTQGLSDVAIKPEYLIKVEEARETNPTVSQNEDQSGDQNGNDQKDKNEDQSNHKRGKGRNKKRPPPLKFSRGSRVCPALIDVSPEREKLPQCTYQNCQFQHDVQKYLEEKPADLGEDCYSFKEYGRCSRGVTCRFAKVHLKTRQEDGSVRNLVDRDIYKSEKKGSNRSLLSRELQSDLRKKKHNFKATDKLVDDFFKAREERKKLLEEEGKEVKEPPSKTPRVENVPVLPSPETPAADKKDDSRNKKKIDWSGKLYLAPLTTVGNLPYRRLCKKFGADITCGEMALALPLLTGHQPEWALVQRHQSEDCFGIQLCGSSPQQMSRVCQLVEEGSVDCDFVDINLGCPIDLIFKKGMGSGLMNREKPLEVMIRSMSQILTRPLTVKMRTGIHMNKKIAHELIPHVKEWGADLVTLHGRSREQRYKLLADWSYAGDCKKAVDQDFPIYGNGDILSYEDYIASKAVSGVDGVMLARGALIKPWIFTEIKEQRHWDISAQERLDMIRDYANYGMEHWGSDAKGIESTRRFLLEWLSFLHRYVPYGLLERPPQKINQRLPPYRGRSDLETLLSSPACSDWISITEMFLGKVPDGFSFEPKHKAHSY